MPQAILLAAAEADLADIWLYIARDSPENADRFIRNIHRVCQEALAGSPMIGRSREELAPGLRSLPYSNYVIFYRPTDHGVEVVRVLHGSRDMEGLF